MSPPREQPSCLRLTVHGCPVPKGRPRFFRGHAVTPDKTRAAERTIKALALAAGWRPPDGRLALYCEFYLPDRRRVDGDNLLKLVLDSLNGVAWHDDSQVYDQHGIKHFSDPLPRTEIEVLRLGDPP